jgi:hypothetical protein
VVPGSHRRGMLSDAALSALAPKAFVTCAAKAGDLLLPKPTLTWLPLCREVSKLESSLPGSDDTAPASTPESLGRVTARVTVPTWRGNPRQRGHRGASRPPQMTTDYSVVVSPAARAQARRIAEWWQANRPAAPDLLCRLAGLREQALPPSDFCGSGRVSDGLALSYSAHTSCTIGSTP